MPLHDPALTQIFQEDKELLEKTEIPVVSVAGTFEEDLKAWHGEDNENVSTDVVFSRAHFSMAYGFVKDIWGEKMDKKKTWFVDPTNYVLEKDWKSISLTEKIGKLLARQPLLKLLKDGVDKFGRSKLPILDSITPPLLYLFEDVEKPILSFHIAAGNILLAMNKKVVQVITDPHVREDYLTHADNDNLTYCVFDEQTKQEAITKANELGMELNEQRVIMTGPPIDHRIASSRKQKQGYDGKRPLRIVITTGGLGTNKGEIHTLVNELLPKLAENNYNLTVYCGTQKDIFDMVKKQAEQAMVKHTVLRNTLRNKFKSNSPQPTTHNPLSLLYHPQIFDANELLIKYGFPNADLFISKPSGDMSYDAVASGSALLTLKPWGVWEERIRDIFKEKAIAQEANVGSIVEQLEKLKQGWVQEAIQKAKNIEKLYLGGNEQIRKVVESLT